MQALSLEDFSDSEEDDDDLEDTGGAYRHSNGSGHGRVKASKLGAAFGDDDTSSDAEQDLTACSHRADYGHGSSLSLSLSLSHPTSVSVSVCAEPPLPSELLRQVFLYLDPHTLYTSVRLLSTQWRASVETDLLPTLFRERTWRVGLRVSRRARKVAPGQQQQQQVQAPVPTPTPSSAPAPQAQGQGQGQGQARAPRETAEQRAARHRRQEADVEALMTIPGTTEEEVAALMREFRAASPSHDEAPQASPATGSSALGASTAAPTTSSAAPVPEPVAVSSNDNAAGGASGNGPLVHFIPLDFTGYDRANASMTFGTGETWHAIFSGFLLPPPDELGAAGASEDSNNGNRLDVDFGLCWRFPGDGQEQEVDHLRDDEARKAEKYWGQPDAENGWLSRFYCVSAGCRHDFSIR